MKRSSSILAVVILSLGISVVLFADLLVSSRKFPPSNVSPVSEASYVVFIDDSLVYARNGSTGVLDFWGSNASEVIQAAIDGLGLDGGIILIQEGTYEISTTVRIPGNVTLSGVGSATKLRLADNANQHVIANKHMEEYVDDNIVIRDLQIDGNGVKQSDEPSVSASAIFLTRVTQSFIEGCLIHDVCSVYNMNAGITTILCKDIVIRRNVICDNGYAGVFLSSGQGFLISNNIFKRNHRGVYLAGNSDSIVQGNQFVSNGEGIRMYQVASNNIISGNLIKDSYEEGILVYISTCKNNAIMDNCLVGNNVQILDHGTDTTISHNQGYPTENGGTINAIHGSYIAHGLVAAPSLVQMTPATQRIVAYAFMNSTHIQVGLWFPNGTIVEEYEEISWYAEV